MPKKRTALGRFKHENAEVVVNGDGHIVVYMGDDERGEFLYRFISSGVYAEGADNSDLLADGALYVAKIHPDGTGQWLALTPETRHGQLGRSGHSWPHGRLSGGRHDHGPARMGRGKSQKGRDLCRADQQQEPWHQDKCGR
jgi:secreted PhoX family phosphatase